MAWTLEHQDSWPFNYTVTDEAGVEVVDQHVYAWSSDARTYAEVMDGKGFHGDDRKQAVEGNAAQLARFRLIAAAPELLETLQAVRDNLVRLAWAENSIMVEGIDKVLAKVKAAS